MTNLAWLSVAMVSFAIVDVILIHVWLKGVFEDVFGAFKQE